MDEKMKFEIKVITAGIVLVFSIVALFAINGALAWFASNDEVGANGMAVEIKGGGVFESVKYYRVTDTAIETHSDGSKHDVYYFSTSPDELASDGRSDFTTPVNMHPYSDLGGSCQILIEVTTKTQDPVSLAVVSPTTQYIGNVIAAATASSNFNISPVGLPLTSVVKYAVIDDVENDSANQSLIVHEHEIYDHERSFVSFDSNDNAVFANPEPNGFTVTPDANCKFYILIDYEVTAVEDINAKIMDYVDKASNAIEGYKEITIGETNLIFSADFDFEVMKQN